MTARQTAAQRDMALVAGALAGAPGEQFRGPEFWVTVARNVCAAHGVHSLLGHTVPPPRGDDPLDVTPQQKRILELLAEGGTRESVAAAMGIAPVTVARHLNMLYRRIHANNAPHAVALALRAGIID